MTDELKAEGMIRITKENLPIFLAGLLVGLAAGVVAIGTIATFF
jgi:hypothetical protein